MSAWRSWTWVAVLLGFSGGALGCAGGSNSVGTGCTGLSACCSMLPSDESAGCDAVASAPSVTASECDDALATYQNAGLCGGSEGSGGGSADGGSGCGALSACCPNVPVAGDPAACAMVASDGTEEACQESLEAYQKAGYCASTAVVLPCPPGSCANGSSVESCASLESCCATLSGSEKAACEADVSVASESECAQSLSELESAGLCD
jgi:hypothetical protein